MSQTLATLPQDARFVLLDDLRGQEVSVRGGSAKFREVTRMTDYRKKTVILFAVEKEAAVPGG